MLKSNDFGTVQKKYFISAKNPTSLTDHWQKHHTGKNKQNQVNLSVVWHDRFAHKKSEQTLNIVLFSTPETRM